MLMLATTAAMIEQFNKNNILILKEMGYEVHVAGNWKEGNPISDERLEQFKVWLAEHHGKWFHIPATREPYDLKNNYVAYREVLGLIKEYEYEFIHCHTPIGSVIGRIAAHKTKTPIIYTAHGFHFYDGAPLVNWLIYYPVEKLLSYWTDILILINQEDYNRAKIKFHSRRTEYVAGVGVDVGKFSGQTVDREEKRKELGLDPNDCAFLSVGELIPRKNHLIVIQALSDMRNAKVKYFICGKGPFEKKYHEMIEKYNLHGQVFLLGFRDDIVDICKAVDLFVFPSLQEGLPLALMEAMASGLPVICSDIRGNRDLIDDVDWLFDLNNIDNLCKKLEHFLRIGEDELRFVAMRNINKMEEYSKDKVRDKMRIIYNTLI